MVAGTKRAKKTNDAPLGGIPFQQSVPIGLELADLIGRPGFGHTDQSLGHIAFSVVLQLMQLAADGHVPRKVTLASPPARPGYSHRPGGNGRCAAGSKARPNGNPPPAENSESNTIEVERVHK